MSMYAGRGVWGCAIQINYKQINVQHIPDILKSMLYTIKKLFNNCFVQIR
jgi:hypothetical protein